MSEHIHMLAGMLLKMSISSFMGYLKGKLVLMIFDRHANLKYKFGKSEFAETYIKYDRNEYTRYGLRNNICPDKNGFHKLYNLIKFLEYNPKTI